MMKTKEEKMLARNRYAETFDFIVGSATNDELNNLVAAVKERRARLARMVKGKLNVGSEVRFTHKGIEYNGKVIGIRYKKATVVCNARPYIVPLSMLSGNV